MKSFITFAVVAILGICMQQASAQGLLGAYTAKDGVATARKSADSSITGPKLVGVLTLGDTTSMVELPLPIEFFDITNGKSQGWIYFFKGPSKKTTADTVVGIAVVKAFNLIFQPIAFDLSTFGPISAFFNAPLPDTWVNSDEMATKIRNDATYKAFAAKNPTVKPLLVPLTVSFLAQFFPTGTPLWQITFGGSPLGGGSGPTLACEVHAVTGEVKCESIATSAEEQGDAGNVLHISPNPAANVIHVAVPEAMRGGKVSVVIVNSIGQTAFSTTVETSAADIISIPVSHLSSGAYRLIARADRHIFGAMFTVAR
jgi:hypothetical protein